MILSTKKRDPRYFKSFIFNGRHEFDFMYLVDFEETENHNRRWNSAHFGGMRNAECGMRDFDIPIQSSNHCFNWLYNQMNDQ